MQLPASTVLEMAIPIEPKAGTDLSASIANVRKQIGVLRAEIASIRSAPPTASELRQIGRAAFRLS
jgi:hypothetical protein